MLSRSPMAKIQACEEWAIHTYEGFKGITIGEYESIDRVVEIAQKLKEHGEAFAAYLDHYNLEDISDGSADPRRTPFGTARSTVPPSAVGSDG